MHNNALLEILHQQNIKTREKRFIKKLIINVAQIAFNLKLKKKSMRYFKKKKRNYNCKNFQTNAYYFLIKKRYLNCVTLYVTYFALLYELLKLRYFEHYL